jgi:hypothetical protein
MEEIGGERLKAELDAKVSRHVHRRALAPGDGRNELQN